MPSRNLDIHPDDEDPPQPGDVLVGARNAWTVVDARPVDSAQWPNRWRLDLRPLGPHRGQHPTPEPGRRVIESGTYPLGMTAREWWAAQGVTAGP